MRKSSAPKLFFLFTFLIFSVNSYAQSSYDYLIEPDKSEAYIFLIDYRKSFELALFDPAKKVNSQLPTAGIPLGMGKSGSNLVIIYAQEYKFRQPIQVIYAMLVDPEQKKVLKKEVIYKNPGKMQIEVEVLRDDAGSLSCVLVRESTMKEGTFGSYGSGSIGKTKTLTMIRLGDNLTPQTKELDGLVLESQYMMSRAGSNNELYVCSYSKKQLTTERFDGSGKKMSQLTIDVSYKQDFEGNFFAKYDSIRENCFYLAMAYSNENKDHVNTVFKFDFNNKKASMTEPIANDKGYLKSLKAANPDTKMNHFVFMKALKPLQLINTADKTILIKEIQTATTDPNGNVLGHFRQGAIISIYTPELKLIKEIPINKYTNLAKWDMNQIHGYAKNEKLYVVTNETSGVKYDPVLYTIDLNNFSISSKKIPDPESGNNWIVVPDDVLWYKNSFLIPFFKKGGTSKLNLNRAWTTENY